MPAKPQWLLRVPKAIAALEEMTVPIVDRGCIEKLLGVSRRRAIELLHSFGGYQVGKTFVVDRGELVERFEAMRRGQTFVNEARRRKRVLRELAEVSRLQRARAVKVQVSRKEVERARGLPEGVRKEPGRLVVEFDRVETLLQRLYWLSQSAARDFDAFRRAVEEPEESSEAK